MGFRTGSYAKVWEVSTVSDTMTKVRISISKKNKATDEYEQDFGDYVMFVGTAAAKKAACLKEGDKIRLGDVDVTNVYRKEENKKYVNYKVFSFEMDDGTMPDKKVENKADPVPTEPDDSNLPF